MSASFYGWYGLFALLLLVFQIVTYWRIFEKAGEEGWKAIIPVYSDYILYKIAWDAKAFWILMGLSLLTLLLSWIPVMGAIFTFIISILLVIIEASCYIKLAKAYGHGTGFGIGLLLLTPVFLLVLAFDKSEYIGPQA